MVGMVCGKLDVGGAGRPCSGTVRDPCVNKPLFFFAGWTGRGGGGGSVWIITNPFPPTLSRCTLQAGEWGGRRRWRATRAAKGSALWTS